MPIDIPITIPATEQFRGTAIGALWKWPQHLRYDELNDTAQKQVDRTSIELRDAYIRGAAAVTEHYATRPLDDIAEKPKVHNWVVTVSISANHRAQEIIAAEGWAVAEDGNLLIGSVGKDTIKPDVAVFAAGQWQSVVRQPEVNTEVNIDGVVQ